MLTYDAMMKCRCVTCPVQVDSACVKPKIAARNELMQNPDLSRIISPGMQKNVDMVKDMNIGTIRGMSIEQMKKMSDQMMKNTPKEQTDSMMPKVEDMPGPYCANGVAVCKDLDYSKICICSGCQVFKDFNLSKGKPMSYFCRDGKPK